MRHDLTDAEQLALTASLAQLEKHELELSIWADRKQAAQQGPQNHERRNRGRNSTAPNTGRSQSSSGLRRRFKRTPRVLFASCGARKNAATPSRDFGKDITSATIGNSGLQFSPQLCGSTATRLHGCTAGQTASCRPTLAPVKGGKPRQIARGAASDPFPLRMHGNDASAPKATAVLKVTIRLDGENIDSFDKQKLELCRRSLAKAAGVCPSSVNLKLARGRVLRRAQAKLVAPVTKTNNKTKTKDEDDVFFDVEEAENANLEKENKTDYHNTL